MVSYGVVSHDAHVDTNVERNVRAGEFSGREDVVQPESQLNGKPAKNALRSWVIPTRRTSPL